MQEHPAVKKVLKIVAAAVVLLVLAAGVGLWAWGNSRHAAAADEALAALGSDAGVTVEDGEYLVFRPTTTQPRLGVIFYPGASCDLRGYAPVLRRIAAGGYFVVGVPMPLEFAFLAPDRALDVQAAYPDVERWALIGHSLGGAMAAGFVHRNPDLVQGLVIWDSYPAPNASLADYERPVWHIHRATPNGMPPLAFSEQRGLFPPTSRWVPIPGGIHMYFGSFDGGGYVEDWAPSITREEQHDRAAAATLEALEAMAGSD
jgi:pimeloyl-ACP methyl ester carboxylesterase